MKFLYSSLKELFPNQIEPEKIGETLTALGLEVEGIEPQDGDFLFEVALTPNLAHGSSLLGIARELSAALGGSYQLPAHGIVEDGSLRAQELAKIHVESKHVSRYFARVLEVKVAPAPDWIGRRLAGSGIKSVNNVVDITNYVLLELGQPLHAFDLDKLEGHQLIVREAKKDEKIITLDGKEHYPTPETLLICDIRKPIALAGMMGSLDSEVSSATSKVLLESAYFDPKTIRRASKRMGIHTEASKLFERGVDPDGLLRALDRAAFLLQKECGAKVAQGVLELSPADFPQRYVQCRKERVHKILGVPLAIGEIEALLKRLHFTIKASTKEWIEVAVPSFRHDIQEEIDLIEEIARLYGYNNIYQYKKEVVYQASSLNHHPLYLLEKTVRRILLSEGLQEFLTCDLISPESAELTKDTFGARSLIALLNPSSIEQSVLRPSLLANMLMVVKHNIDHDNRHLAGFEVGRVHFKTKESFVEPTVASIVLTGNAAPHHFESQNREVDFFDLKGILENFLNAIGVQNVRFIPSESFSFHPKRQAKMVSQGIEMGIMGEVHPLTLKKSGIEQRVFFAELDLEDVAKLIKKPLKMKPLALYPASVRDWTLTLKQDLSFEKLLQLIEEEKPEILEDVSLTCIYRSEKIGVEWQNVTLRLTYRHLDRTISLKEVESGHDLLIQNVIEKLRKVNKVKSEEKDEI